MGPLHRAILSQQNICQRFMVQGAPQLLDQVVPVQEVVATVQESQAHLPLTVVQEEVVIVIGTMLLNLNMNHLILQTVESYQKIMDCSMPI